jgi:hypothetical protein
MVPTRTLLDALTGKAALSAELAERIETVFTSSAALPRIHRIPGSSRAVWPTVPRTKG